MCHSKNKKMEITTKERVAILFLNACAFRRIAYAIANDMNSFGTECNTFSAIIVNGLLAVELYLKFLSCCNDPKSSKVEFEKTHDAAKLFENLEESIKNEIDAKDKIGLFSDFLLGLHDAATGSKGDPVEWRYLLHAKKEDDLEYHFDICTMIKFIEALYDVSKRVINTSTENYDLPKLSSPNLDEEAREIISEYEIVYHMGEQIV